MRFRPRCPTILLVSDRASTRHGHADRLRSAGYTVHTADAHRSAMVILRDVDPSLTVIDLPTVEQQRLLREARTLDANAAFVLADGRGPDELLQEIEDLRRPDEERPPAA